MRKIIKNTLKSGFSLLLTLALALAYVPALEAQAAEVVDGHEFDRALSQLRQEFFRPAPSGAFGMSSGLRQVHIGDSGRVHVPPIYGEPAVGGGFGIQSTHTPQLYNVGATRNFSALAGSSMGTHQGRLVRQSNYVNMWFLQPTEPGQGSLPAITDNSVLLDELLAQFDDIYLRMTRDFGAFRNVRVVTPYNNMPIVGDIDENGRVNVLMYNIGGNAGGFFSSGDFMTNNNNTPIPMFHVGVQGVTGSEADKLWLYEVFAHEFQHLLFFMHFGVYAADHQEFLWFDEALSELAGKLWAVNGTELVSHGRIFSASENSYTPGDGRPGDFVSFNNSLKNYGMSRLYATLMNEKASDLVGNVYRYFTTTFPPSAGVAAFAANQTKASSMSMREIVGNALAAAGLTGSTGAVGNNAFDLLYFLFMENFAADGGNIVSGAASNPTFKFYTNQYSAHNLWGVRPHLGMAPGTLPGGQGLNGAFVSGGSWASLSDRTAFPVLNPGGNIALSGYNGSFAWGATHEMFYRLAGESAGNPVLTISINDNNPATQYYVVVPNDAPGAVSSSLNPQLGRNGATVHPLLRNSAPNEIDTGGQTAYLLAVTLFRNVSGVSASYSWGSAVPAAPTVLSHPSNQTVAEGRNAVFSVLASGSPPPAFQWQVSTDDGATWSDIDGAVSATLTLTGITIGSHNGNRYRCVITNTIDGNLNTVISNSATLTVTEGFGAVPQTGISDMRGNAAAMYAFIIISAALWGYIFHRERKKKAYEKKHHS